MVDFISSRLPDSKVQELKKHSSPGKFSSVAGSVSSEENISTGEGNPDIQKVLDNSKDFAASDPQKVAKIAEDIKNDDYTPDSKETARALLKSDVLYVGLFNR